MSSQVEHLAEYYKECEEKYLIELPLLRKNKQIWSMLSKYRELLTKIVEMPEGYEMYAHSHLRGEMFKQYGSLFNEVSEEKTYIIDYLDNLIITEESLTRYDMCSWYVKKTFDIMNSRSGRERWSMESVYAYSYEETYNFWGEQWNIATIKHPDLLNILKKQIQTGLSSF